MGDVPPRFVPRPLDRLEVENPMTAGMRRLEPQDARKMHGERLRQARRLAPLSPRMRARMKRYALGAIPCFVVINGFFHYFYGAGPGLGALWVQVPVAALVGAVIGALRSSRVVSGFLVSGAWLAMAALAGDLRIGLLTILHMSIWFCLGMAIGVDQDMAREEGLV